MTPIAAAVMPLKEGAVQRAVAQRREYIEGFVAANPAGTDLRTKYPYPNGRMSRAEYRKYDNAARFARMVLKQVERQFCGNYGDPEIVAGPNTEAIERMLTATAQATAAEFDAYVAKLEGEVGECDEASVEGALWNGSILTVRKGKRVERWKTQQIVNWSGLGTAYNQWPTRKVK